MPRGVPAQPGQPQPPIPRLPDDPDLAAAMKMAGDADLDLGAARSQAQEQLDQAARTVADSVSFLSRAGIQLEDKSVKQLSSEVAAAASNPIPQEPSPDLSALLGRILLQHGVTTEKDAIALLQGLAGSGGVYRLNEHDEIVKLGPIEERERQQRVAAKAAAALARPSTKQAVIWNLLQVDKRHWVQVTMAEQKVFYRNGVEMGVPKGTSRVPPYVAECIDYWHAQTARQDATNTFHQNAANITDQILRGQKSFRELVIQEYYAKVS